ncbi:hypothetical protein DUNSADRAFT_8086 [Dunaliella salina]|uniref:Encoded protein n=1 Tax=Dunaliella salina TaxID=3046 RepID=A0ABQ7FT03_DUNSA|nr:hypothetical protein DUNSADRAFT_8086 [Dunaliella salina]|eukprot:KAF5825622.1 hypothetical protein DUNSADRAFT_8086 [Dunaliella salina]
MPWARMLPPLYSLFVQFHIASRQQNYKSDGNLYSFVGCGSKNMYCLQGCLRVREGLASFYTFGASNLAEQHQSILLGTETPLQNPCLLKE